MRTGSQACLRLAYYCRVWTIPKKKFPNVPQKTIALPIELQKKHPEFWNPSPHSCQKKLSKFNDYLALDRLPVRYSDTMPNWFICSATSHPLYRTDLRSRLEAFGFKVWALSFGPSVLGFRA